MNPNIILLLFFCGCVNPNKPGFETNQILECVFSHLIDKSDSEKSMKIFVADVQNWRDSTSHISVTVDTKNTKFIAKLKGLGIKSPFALAENRYAVIIKTTNKHKI